jgi:hypothetical protein
MLSGCHIRMAMLLMVLACLGCGAGNPLDLQAVSGSVTLDGKPLEQGSIQFVPQDNAAGLLSGALITAGTYSIPQDKGLPPGKYTVRISSAAADRSSSASSGPPGAESRVPAKERIPARYNSQSQLAAEVTAEGDNTFDFPLTNAATK